MIITTDPKAINVIVGAPNTKGLVITKPDTVDVTVGTPGKPGIPAPRVALPSSPSSTTTGLPSDPSRTPST